MMWRKVPESRLPKDFSDLVDLNDGCGEECGEVAAPRVLEESLWSGWQESRLALAEQAQQSKAKVTQPKAKSKK